MRNPYSRIVTRLQETEKELLAILADAATQGDYGTIDRTREAARRIREIISGLEAGLSEPAQVISGAGDAGHRTSSKPSRRDGRRRKGPSKKPPGYPRFFVRDDCLHKEGWSKKAQRTYTHRIPGSLFRGAVQALQQIAEKAVGSCSTEFILNELALVTRDAVPTYQVYILIAFLRSHGVIRPAGRGEYALPRQLQARALEQWAQLEVSSAKPDEGRA